MLAFIVCTLLALPPANADDALNEAYRQVMAKNPPAANNSRQGQLQWTEQHWIVYRDAEVDFQAWIAGTTHADEAVRGAALDALTKARTVELQHIATDGLSDDFSAPPKMVSENGVDVFEDAVAMAQTYAALKDAVSHRHNANLMATLVLSQKAWLTFADLQSGDDGSLKGPIDPSQGNPVLDASNARLDRLRVAQLQADATALSLVLKPVTSTDEEGHLDLDTYVSRDHSLRIEQNGEKAWLISNATGERKEFPQQQEETDSGATVLVSEYEFSPDNAWIFRTQKFYHGMCGAYLYRRVSGLTYRSATHERFDILAWKFFEKAAQKKLPDVENGGVVRLVEWRPEKIRFSLNAKDTLESGWIADWQADYDFAKGVFSVPTELIEHDREAVSP